MSSAPEQPEVWTVRRLLGWTAERFEAAGIESPRVDAEHLLSFALECSRMNLYLDHDKVVNAPERTRFREVVKRRLAREPVAYIEGKRGFHALGLELQVDRRVLIPRPETELLVDWILEDLAGPRPMPEHEPEAEPSRAPSRAPRPEEDTWVELDPVGPEVGDEDEMSGTPGGTSGTPGGTGGTSGTSGTPGGTSGTPSGTGGTPGGTGGTPGGTGETPGGTGETPGGTSGTPGGTSGTPGGTGGTPEAPDRRAVLDVGTGSGAIALALKHARPSLRVVACDVSEDALGVARDNAQRLELEVPMVRSDLLTDVRAPVGGWAVIAANLPYIREPHWRTLAPEVQRFEPRLALEAGDDGLDAIRRLVAQAPAQLAPGGGLYLEIGFDQGESVPALMRAQGLVDVELRRDHAGHARMVRGRRAGG